jgi:hypothetical protein
VRYVGFPCRLPPNPVIRPAHAPAQVRTTQVRATERAVGLRKLMYSRPSTTNRVLAVWSHNRRSSRHSQITICTLMTPPKIVRCTILASPGPTITGTRYIYTRYLILMIYFRIFCRGSALSVTYPFVRLLLTIFLNLIDNKLCPASRSSHLMFSKDRDRISIPLVCSGSLSLFVCSHWDCAGFEYFGDPNSRSDGYITWMMDDTPTIRMGAGAVGPDQGTGGSGVSQRLISEEPMVKSYHPFTLPYSFWLSSP